MKRLAIDSCHFMMGFGRDDDYEAHPTEVYVDLETGDVIWVYLEDEHASSNGIPSEDNKLERKKIESNKARYFLLRPFSHGEQHEILKEFLKSNWTDDDEARTSASLCYHKSFGWWKKEIQRDE